MNRSGIMEEYKSILDQNDDIAAIPYYDHVNGYGLEGLKRLKVNKGPFFGIPRIKTYKNFDEILKDKNNKPQNQAQNKNNSCLIGGRILTLNELDQIIDRIKKQK